MIRVGIDATPLLGTRTGIGAAVAGILEALPGHPRLDVIGYGLTATGWRLLPALLPAGVRSARRRPLPAAALLRAWARFDHPRLESATGPIEVAHGTNFVVPPTRRAARLVSVWDLTAWRYPELCTPTSRLYPALIERAVGTGAMVHTASQYVADEVASDLGVPAERVRMVSPGITAPSGTRMAAAGGAPYVLALGTVEPRKDLPRLVAAFDQIAARHHDLELRIVGPPGWGEEDLAEAVEAAHHRARIRRTGWVDDIGEVLQGAAVFAYPSLYEGFGFPPLEAMARGVPVVATSAGSLPEVLGDGACLVPVRDADALAEALDQVLTDQDRRSALVRAGHRQVARYSWAAAGEELSALYEELASHN
ncbi:MAG: glycosyltransferase family 4 protein [Actinomycetota bacterium]|nr:glycosyltransferase family 4 protein [Actinomycetota bacterium]